MLSTRVIDGLEARAVRPYEGPAARRCRRRRRRRRLLHHRPLPDRLISPQ